MRGCQRAVGVKFDQNIFDIPVDTIEGAKVLVTVLNGKVVYDPTGLVGDPVGMPPPPSDEESSVLDHASLSWWLMAIHIGMISYYLTSS